VQQLLFQTYTEMLIAIRAVGVYLQAVVRDSVIGTVVGGLVPETVSRVLTTGGTVSVWMNVTLRVAFIQMQPQSTVFPAVKSASTHARDQ